MDSGEVMEGLPELTGSEHVPEGHESEENGNLRLAEPPPFVLHQQPIEEDESTEESSDTAGTYHIIDQQLMPTGQVQLTLSDGVNILQTTIAADQLQGFETGEQSILLQAADIDAKGEISYVAADVTKQELASSADQETALSTNNDESLVQSNTQSDNQSERVLQVINNSVTDANETDQSALPSGTTGQFFILTDEDKTKQGQVIQNGTQPMTPNVKQFVESLVQQEQMNTMTSSSGTELSNQEPAVSQIPGQSLVPVSKTVNKPTKEVKKPDLTKPIEVTDHMEVVVNGKKCLLKVNPDTGQLCAYPLVSSGKRRGRPKKSEVKGQMSDEAKRLIKEQSDLMGEGVQKLVPDQTSSAAQGLLELSNTGPDGVRRSARSRGKPKTLQEYEVLELSSDDDAADDGDDEVLPSGAIRKRKTQVNKDYIPPVAIQTPGVPRRGRGRPRRYPRPDDTPVTNQIPAVIIPSGDGQTIMMAPLQGMSSLEAFQEQVKNMPIFQQSGVDDDGLQYLNISSLIDSSDGNTVSVQLGGAVNLGDTEDISSHSVLNSDSIDDNTEDSGDLKPVVLTGGDETDVKDVKVDIQKELIDKLDVGNNGIKDKVSEPNEGHPTIIQIPENLLPMFTQKKDPVKIGLKSSDAILEKMKCQVCDFQGYYEQQFQDHILTHKEALKCKCCKYACFQKDSLIEHFRKNHPRCICNFCDHMAEHAYIIKRHTMRHTQVGCKCDVCGKVYKDQYVLKMHVKMVHMPAEVLFECNVCSKKFTRKAHLKRHLRIHDPEKPFKCPHCQYRGCEKSDIVKHLLVHEEPKHQCNICQKSFRHIKNKELHMKRHNGQRDYKCGVCDFYGYTFTDIRKHIERKHTDCKSLICDKCGMVFRSDLQYKEHKSQACDVFMIEQALAIATSDGGTAQATIQIPSNYTLDGNQQLQVGGQSVSIDKDGQITVHSVGLPGDSISLTDEQIQAVTQGQISESDLQNLVSQTQLSESELHAVVSQGQIIDTGQADDENVENDSVMHGISDEVRTEIQEMGNEVRPVLDLYKTVSVDNDRAELMYKNEVDDVNYTEGEEEEEETTMDEDDIHDDDEDDIRDEEEHMEGIVSDSDDKTNMENDQIMGMVNIMR